MPATPAVDRAAREARNESTLDMTSSAISQTSQAPLDGVDDVDIDSGNSVTLLRSVGRIIAALRRQAGLTQAELGERIGYGEEMVSKVERGIRIPRPEFIDGAERVLKDRAGVLAALKEELSRASYSDILRGVHREEAQAVRIHAYDTYVLNALLQTEDYTRAVLGMRTPPLPGREVEQRVTARLQRQQVVHRDIPPVKSFEVHGMRVHTERDRVPDLDTTYSRIRAQALSSRDTLTLIAELLTEDER